MAKIRLYVKTCYVGSKVEEVIDTVEDWGLAENEWEEMDDGMRASFYNEWLHENMEWGVIDV